MCPPNTYSSDGFVNSTCQNCSDGQYQLMYGAENCTYCTTDDKNDTSFKECYGIVI